MRSSTGSAERPETHLWFHRVNDRREELICKNPEAVVFDGADADCGVVLLRDEDPET